MDKIVSFISRKTFFALTGVLFLGGALFFYTPARAVITDGMPAVDLIGQYDPHVTGSEMPDFTRSGANGGANLYGMNGPLDAETDAASHHLFVADIGNSRVLVFDLDQNNRLVDTLPDHVLGQPDFVSSSPDVNASTLNKPTALAWDAANSRLFVSDYANNRVLAFDLSAGITDGMAASHVLGQSDLYSNASALTQGGLDSPFGLAWDAANSRLFVSDYGNNRVLAFDLSAGITDGMAASHVLGQVNFASGTPAAGQARMNLPNGLAWDAASSRLFVADNNNFRTLAFDLSAGITNGMPAANVLGQPNFNSRVRMTTATGAYSIAGLDWDADHSLLWAVDFGNSRVLAYDLSAGITNGMAASHVLGQPGFTSDDKAASSTGMNNPGGVFWDGVGGRLYVCDEYNNRVLAFDLSAGITDGMAAANVLGQREVTSPLWPPTFGAETFDKGGANSGPFAWSVASRGNMVIDTVNHRLFQSDSLNRRVMVYDLDAQNRLVSRVADHVLGQNDFGSSDMTTTASGMAEPMSIAWDPVHSRLFVAESLNSRVLVFDLSAGITDGMAASHVLGQPDFTSNDTSSVTASSMSRAAGLVYDVASQRLFVSDSYNYRVLVFDLSAGITNGMPAANVLGQTDFTSNVRAVTQANLYSNGGLAWDASGSKLFVGDYRRVLVFDLSAGITNGMPAANVLGQPNFTSGTHATTQTGMGYPFGLLWDGANNRLFVSDFYNNRVLAYDFSAGITDGMAASGVLGQTSYTSDAAATSQTGLNGPAGLGWDPSNSWLYVTEVGNRRITVFAVDTVVPPIVVDGGSQVSATVNPDGSVTYTLVGDANGRTYQVTLPPSAAPIPPATDMVIDVNDNNPNKPRLSVSALLQPGVTKSVVLPLGTGSYVCVQDVENAQFLFTGCNPQYRVTIPAAGTTVEYEPGKTISVDVAGEYVTIAGLRHSAVEAGSDEDGDGLDDNLDHCAATSGDAAHVGCPSAARVTFQRHTVGQGNKPAANKQPVAGAEVRAFSLAGGTCADVVGTNPHSYGTVYSTCPADSAATTAADGTATLGLLPGSYLLIAEDPQTSTFAGVRSGDLAEGETIDKFLQVIVRADGSSVPAKTTEKKGSLLYIVEPEYVEWDSETELYPFVLDAVDGDWGVTVAVEPPEGFTADHDVLSDDLSNEYGALQFTLTDVGSCWECGTGAVITIRHKGKTERLHRNIPTPMAEAFARGKGLDLDKLKHRGVTVTRGGRK